MIPAFNEGENVARTIESVLASDYPTHRLSVIVANDGSTDDTGTFIDRVARRFPDRVTAIHLPRNQGKRHALYAGFSRATTEVIATVDSDYVPLAVLLATLFLHEQMSAARGVGVALATIGVLLVSRG